MTPKPVKTVQDPAIAWAENLWKRLETHLIDSQNTIIAIIETRAWEPLGYESFSKAWVDRIMTNITITSELRPHVVYQMFSEGLTPAQIADAVKGISEDTAKRLKDARDIGVPADQATTVVRRHLRRKPSKWGHIHLEVPPEILVGWKLLAEAHGRTVTEIALEAVTETFNQLA